MKKRFFHLKDGRTFDLCWKPYTLNKLMSIGIENEYKTYKEIINALGGFSNKNHRRIELLKLQSWLSHKEIKSDKEKNIKIQGRAFVYTLSGRGRHYLRRFGDFLNENGWLFSKVREKPKEIIIRETEKPVFFEKKVEEKTGKTITEDIEEVELI